MYFIDDCHKDIQAIVGPIYTECDIVKESTKLGIKNSSDI